MYKGKDTIQDRLKVLTLEILFLLTGEDYRPLKKYSDSETPCLLPKKRNKKILEVINKMIELLTGEISIRCQDFTIYFSMEEWEYLEGHKDLYKDILHKSWLPLPFPGSDEVPNTKSTSNYINEVLQGCINPLQSDTSGVVFCTHGTSYPKEEPILYEEGYLQCSDTSMPADYKGSISTCVKEKPKICKSEDCLPYLDSSTGTNYSSSFVKEYSISAEENLPYLDISIQTHHTQSAKEDPLSDEESLPCPTICTPIHIKEEPPSHEEVDHPLHSESSTPTHPMKDESFSCDEEDLAVTTFIVEDSQCTRSDAKDTEHNFQSKRNGVICSLCGKTFGYKVELLAHHRVHSGEKPFECSDCGKCFTSKSNLVTHCRSHTGERPYTCEECGKAFFSSSNLIIHLRIHTGQKPYSCSVCGKTFNNSSYRCRHEKAHSKETKYSCSECGKCFKYATSFEKHKRSHREEKPFTCCDCGKFFSRASILAVHQRIHTGERPFICQICGKGFVVRSHLVVHERIHSGEKPYYCTTCGKTFVSSSELRIHQKYHMEQKPYSCPVCQKGFVCNSALVRHKTVHTKETPFSCSVCGRCYRNRSDSLKHSRTHSDTVVHSECGNVS